MTIYYPKPKNGMVTPNGEIEYHSNAEDGMYKVNNEVYSEYIYEGDSFGDAVTAFQEYGKHL